VKPLLCSFWLLSAIGLTSSVVVHVGTLAGSDVRYDDVPGLPLVVSFEAESLAWIGAYLAFLLIGLLPHMSGEARRPARWSFLKGELAFRRCPAWMRYLTYALFTYSFLYGLATFRSRDVRDPREQLLSSSQWGIFCHSVGFLLFYAGICEHRRARARGRLPEYGKLWQRTRMAFETDLSVAECIESLREHVGRPTRLFGRCKSHKRLLGHVSGSCFRVWPNEKDGGPPILILHGQIRRAEQGTVVSGTFRLHPFAIWFGVGMLLMTLLFAQGDLTALFFPLFAALIVTANVLTAVPACREMLRVLRALLRAKPIG